ncbi:hypothetical protein CEP51_003163 [Fusarium floridanum]|uniref:Uncharacterized protein n=1 Tax=Fusarium floridanum TaxID=1325733 RepID=A0A428S7J2_9HYPO|nr:hypothetical protein CEP51_003163 [Fusarium floridanum]
MELDGMNPSANGRIQEPLDAACLRINGWTIGLDAVQHRAELIFLAVKTSYGIFCILSLLLGNKKPHLLISRRAQFSVVCALLPNDLCLDSVGHIPHQLGLKHCLRVLIQVTAVVRFEPTGPFLHPLAGDLVIQ